MGFEVDVIGGAFGDADVATGVEAPALGFDVGEGGDFAEAGYVGVGAVGEDFVDAGLAAVDGFDGFVAIEAGDVARNSIWSGVNSRWARSI